MTTVGMQQALGKEQAQVCLMSSFSIYRRGAQGFQNG